MGGWVESRRRWWLVGGAAVVYVLLALPLVYRQGVHWDEQTDMEIAAAFLDGPRGLMIGSGTDSITTRLPMFSVALLDFVGLELSLHHARLVSCAVGVLTLFGAYVLGCLLCDRRKAFVAVLLLATSPYFIAYSPLALSEGDAFITAATTWIAVAAVQFARQPTWGRCALLGILLGLGVSAKFSGIALVPAVTLATLLPAVVRPPAEATKTWSGTLVWLAVVVALGGWLAAQAIATGAVEGFAGVLPNALQSGALRYVSIAVAWIIGLTWSWRNRDRFATLPGVLILPLALAVVTFFVFPPAHTVNKWLFSNLWKTSFDSGKAIELGYVAEIAVFHLMVVLFKPGILVGAMLWVATARAIARSRSRPQWRLPLTMIAFYFVFLLLLPWAQVRYMLPLFPLLAIFGADLLVEVGRRRPRLTTAVALCLALALVWDYRLCYPDLNLNGYQWVGTRYIAGRSTLGYRGIGQVGEDGVDEILRWSLRAVPPGATLASYVPARHIVAAVLVDPPFRVIDGNLDRDALREADYVLTSLNGDVVVGDGPENPHGDPYKFPQYDRAALEHDFERVFSVHRAFGLEVATVWKRR